MGLFNSFPHLEYFTTSCAVILTDDKAFCFVFALASVSPCHKENNHRNHKAIRTEHSNETSRSI